jgi:deoxyribodipyrimidine photo-lyase
VVDPGRVHVLRGGEIGEGCVLYWMSREQRARDNWAMLYAQEQALERRSALHVVFCLADRYLGATWRQYDFMIGGLRQVEQSLREKQIPLHVLSGAAGEVLPGLARSLGCCLLVTDFDPLRTKRLWADRVAAALDVPVHEVDAHNVAPCRVVSPKQEYGAYTLRPKIHRLLPAYLDAFPELEPHPFPPASLPAPVEWTAAALGLAVDRGAPPVEAPLTGEDAAAAALRQFLDGGLAAYPAARNDPNQDGQSGLSPYLHFGQLAPQRVVLEVARARAPEAAKEAFLEELIVRRELADNYCLHNANYDSVAGFPVWARDTLRAHEADVRPYLYSREDLEHARTHDPLWNAAQVQMVRQGKMHGYLRMYWAKKILEWSLDAGEAMQTAIGLNDRYELDGRDPNGYAGIAWSMGGVHDRPWPPRPVFGKVRSMTFGGARKKFDVDAFVRRFASPSGAG